MQNKKSYTIPQVRIQMVKDRTLYSDEPLKNPEAVIRLLAKKLSRLDREVFGVISLQPDLKPINLSIVSIGSLDYCCVEPRDVFKPAIMSNARNVIIFHNHPSNDLSPSREDIMVTDRLLQCGELLGIKVTDHIIFGIGDKYYSMLENDILKAKEITYSQELSQLRWGL